MCGNIQQIAAISDTAACSEAAHDFLTPLQAGKRCKRAAFDGKFEFHSVRVPYLESNVTQWIQTGLGFEPFSNRQDGARTKGVGDMGQWINHNNEIRLGLKERINEGRWR